MARLPRFWPQTRSSPKAVVAARRKTQLAHPGAAQSLPLKLMKHMPVLGRYARQRAEQRAERLQAQQRLLSPSRLIASVRARNDRILLAAEDHLPLLGPALRQMRKPMAQTARVVQAAREVRKPMTRWERLREAAWLAIEDPAGASRWEHLMGLGVALATGGATPAVERPSRWSRVLQRVKPVSRKAPTKKAGSGKNRNRPGFRKRDSR